MKKRILLTAIMVVSCIFCRASVEHLLPRVQLLGEKDCIGFHLKRNVTLADPTGCEVLAEVLTEAGATLSPDAGAKVTVTLVNEIPGAFNHNLAGFPDEAYSIDISENKVSISALTPTGVVRAAQTLSQLAIGTEILTAATIIDWPAFKLRGVMHDVGRSFISVEELKKQLRLLSAFKVNTFHWHLTENQAWRFEVKAHPELTSDASMTRFAGQYYTQQQCREVMAVARKYGITVIPEIDMPGHSEAFVRATGCDMQSARGKEILLTVLEEVADVFADSPYIHIGADEKAITDGTFLDTMIDKLHSLGKKVVCWNPISGVNVAAHNFDMTQMWSTAGKKIAGIPNIDCRYNYVNHFDVFADLVGIYKSSIYYEQQGTDEVAGTITALWNDRKTPAETDIIAQNNMYANVLASAERAWIGGGRQYIETGGTMLPNSGAEFEEFADWERRFLLHKELSLKNEPIPYVKQTNVRWHVSQGFDNGGDMNAAFAPETDLNGDFALTPVTGAGIYLRHTWGGTVPGLYGNAAINQTAYAWTYVYSPAEQTAGALIEFQNYGRSEKDTAPDNGRWDRKGSRIWLNDEEILPAADWSNAGKGITNETDLLNENLTARKPVKVVLKEGWNKVFVKLPYVTADGIRLNKWMWTFVLTDTEGRNALEGLLYSPTQCLDPGAETLSLLITEARSAVKAVIKDEVGYYPSTPLDADLLAKADEIEATLGANLTASEREAQRAVLQTLLDAFRAGYASAGIVQPQSDVYYHMYTPLRDSRYASAASSTLNSVAEPGENAAWNFSQRSDGTYNIVNYSTGRFISPAAAENTQLRLTKSEPAKGWQVLAADETGYVIIVSETAQFNQTNSGLGYKIYNWGNGTNISDTGCKYRLTATDLKKDHDDAIAEITSARPDTTAIYYDLIGRRLSYPAKGINIINGKKILK